MSRPVSHKATLDECKRLADLWLSSPDAQLPNSDLTGAAAPSEPITSWSVNPAILNSHEAASPSRTSLGCSTRSFACSGITAATVIR